MASSRSARRIVEAVDGYGSGGVSATAIALRSSHRESDYHERMHDDAEELERLSMMVLLICFGAAGRLATSCAASPGRLVGFSLAALLPVRPVSGWLGTVGSDHGRGERAASAPARSFAVLGWASRATSIPMCFLGCRPTPRPR